MALYVGREKGKPIRWPEYMMIGLIVLAGLIGVAIAIGDGREKDAMQKELQALRQGTVDTGVVTASFDARVSQMGILVMFDKATAPSDDEGEVVDPGRETQSRLIHGATVKRRDVKGLHPLIGLDPEQELVFSGHAGFQFRMEYEEGAQTSRPDYWHFAKLPDGREGIMLVYTGITTSNPLAVIWAATFNDGQDVYRLSIQARDEGGLSPVGYECHAVLFALDNGTVLSVPVKTVPHDLAPSLKHLFADGEATLSAPLKGITSSSDPANSEVVPKSRTAG